MSNNESIGTAVKNSHHLKGVHILERSLQTAKWLICYKLQCQLVLFGVSILKAQDELDLGGLAHSYPHQLILTGLSLDET